MNESPFTACQNSVWFESYVFVKFTILSPNFCHNKDNNLRQTLHMSSAVPLDFWAFPIELALWNFTCVFIITFLTILHFFFSILKNFLNFLPFSSFWTWQYSRHCTVPLNFSAFPIELAWPAPKKNITVSGYTTTMKYETLKISIGKWIPANYFLFFCQLLHNDAWE